MGYSLSWIGVKTSDKLKVLARAGLDIAKDGGGEVEMLSRPFCITDIPTGWTIIISNNFQYASDENLTYLSEGADIVGVQAEEHMMFSAARRYAKSRELWSVCRDSQQGGDYDLITSGNLPDGFERIESGLATKQAADQRVKLKSIPADHPLKVLFGDAVNTGAADRWVGVDYMFDAPIELAAELTGFRHDRGHFDWGRPRFVRLDHQSTAQTP